MFLFPFFSSFKEDYYHALLKSCELNAEVRIWSLLDFPLDKFKGLQLSPKWDQESKKLVPISDIWSLLLEPFLAFNSGNRRCAIDHLYLLGNYWFCNWCLDYVGKYLKGLIILCVLQNKEDNFWKVDAIKTILFSVYTNVGHGFNFISSMLWVQQVFKLLRTQQAQILKITEFQKCKVC
jgi:hypothetical protein